MKKYNPKDKKNRKQIREKRKEKPKIKANHLNNENFKKENILKLNKENKYIKNEELLNKEENLEDNNYKKINLTEKNIDFTLTVECDKKFKELSFDGIIWDTSNTFFPDTLGEIDFLEYYGVDLYEKIKENKMFLKPDEVFLKETNLYNGKYIFFISSPDLKDKKRLSSEDKETLRKIYKNLFHLAKTKKIQKIIIPNIRMRQRKIDIETATDIFIKECIDFNLNYPNNISEVIILTNYDDEYTYISKYIKDGYYENFNFLKKDMLKINEDSVSWEDRKRHTEGSYPVYKEEIKNIFDKLFKYNVLPVSKKSILNIMDIKNVNINPAENINQKIKNIKQGKEREENLSNKEILKYLEYIYNEEKNHDGIISYEIKNGNLKFVIQVLVKRRR